MSRSYGTPLNIIKFNDEKAIEFNKAELEGLLLHPSVKDRKIVVLSIVGAFRKGKSFFLDYCLRYLYGNVRDSSDTFLFYHFDLARFLFSTNQF